MVKSIAFDRATIIIRFINDLINVNKGWTDFTLQV